MDYVFTCITQKQAEDIAFNWHYEGEYSFHDMEADIEDLEEFTDPETRGDSMFAVTNEDELVGFFGVHSVEEGVVDIGLGMRPDLTGDGRGEDFLKAGMRFTLSHFNPKTITLAVAVFNHRAIKVYKRVGFKEIETYMQNTNGSTYEFLKMEYHV